MFEPHPRGSRAGMQELKDIIRAKLQAWFSDCVSKCVTLCGRSSILLQFQALGKLTAAGKKKATRGRSASHQASPLVCPADQVG